MRWAPTFMHVPPCLKSQIIVMPPCLHRYTVLAARAQNLLVVALTQAACIMAFLVKIYPELAASAMCSFSHQCTRVFSGFAKIPAC